MGRLAQLMRSFRGSRRAGKEAEGGGQRSDAKKGQEKSGKLVIGAPTDFRRLGGASGPASPTVPVQNGLAVQEAAAIHDAVAAHRASFHPLQLSIHANGGRMSSLPGILEPLDLPQDAPEPMMVIAEEAPTPKSVPSRTPTVIHSSNSGIRKTSSSSRTSSRSTSASRYSQSSKRSSLTPSTLSRAASIINATDDGPTAAEAEAELMAMLQDDVKPPAPLKASRRGTIVEAPQPQPEGRRRLQLSIQGNQIIEEWRFGLEKGDSRPLSRNNSTGSNAANILNTIRNTLSGRTRSPSAQRNRSPSAKPYSRSPLRETLAHKRVPSGNHYKVPVSKFSPQAEELRFSMISPEEVYTPEETKASEISRAISPFPPPTTSLPPIPQPDEMEAMRNRAISPFPPPTAALPPLPPPTGPLPAIPGSAPPQQPCLTPTPRSPPINAARRPSSTQLPLSSFSLYPSSRRTSITPVAPHPSEIIRSITATVERRQSHVQQTLDSPPPQPQTPETARVFNPHTGLAMNTQQPQIFRFPAPCPAPVSKFNTTLFRTPSSSTRPSAYPTRQNTITMGRSQQPHSPTSTISSVPALDEDSSSDDSGSGTRSRHGTPPQRKSGLMMMAPRIKKQDSRDDAPFYACVEAERAGEIKVEVVRSPIQVEYGVEF